MVIPLISPTKFLGIKKPQLIKAGADLNLGGDGGGMDSTQT